MNIQKRVVLIGPAGCGKSWLGNELLNRPGTFKSAASTDLVTDTILEATNKIPLQDNKKLVLTIVDTPGIGDTKGRSQIFMDQIVNYTRTHGANMLFIILPHGRINPGLKNNLNALKECINGFYDLQTVLIINKVPKESRLKKSNPPQTLQDVENEAKQSFAAELNTRSLATNILIETDLDIDDEVKFNALKVDIYNAIAKSTMISSKILRTWTETLAFYQDIIDGKVSAKEALNDKIKRHRDQISRLEDDRKSAHLRIGLGFVGPFASSGLVFVPFVGIPAVAVANIAFAAMAVSSAHQSKFLREAIDAIRNNINALSLEEPNAIKEIDEAKKKLDEVGHYLH
ncbi:unnamed protein product [Rotaria magnacalcarata]|uniref:AIG1-type G domain-containing protein n=1 Tax=Rotaria magnacalcarata TaxID=392030 RepID=A0A817AB19_9BILA|nr:unnamed protein product [Rotaria magnacalcarata]CAF4267482.1 unnamed protein product [Rotaria magnacalcarata]